MKVSYNWLKWYIPDAPEAEKLADIFTYHVAEVESVEALPDGDSIFDIKILPNRAPDLLSHQGIARELSSLLSIKFVDPTPKYKVPESKSTELKVELNTNACRRYMGRIIRNVKVCPSPEWMIKHLESIGERSISNVVDATNIVMFDCGEPTHIFDLNKVKEKIIVRQAKEGETMTTLDNKKCTFTSSDFVIADIENALAIGGVKGGKAAEVDSKTTDLILEVANFDPTIVRKTSARTGIRTEGSKRWENSPSPELAAYGMLELSALIAEMCPEAIFEEVVDIYPKQPEEKKLVFSNERISSILGLKVTNEEIKNILERYHIEYTEKDGNFEITVPHMRLDLTSEEDMAEEIGRVLGYDKVKPIIPKIDFKSKANEDYEKMKKVRAYLLSQGYSEVMTTSFREKGQVEVLESASDKKFLRENLHVGLRESAELNKRNLPLLLQNQVMIFEIGTVWSPQEEMHIAFTDSTASEVKELSLDEFYKTIPLEFLSEPINFNSETKFKMWSLYPFISRDIAVWMPKDENAVTLKKLLIENATELLVKEPYLVDSFVGKDGRISYAFRLVFQSYERTLTDAEINEIMDKISNKIKAKNGWQVR